MKMTDDLIARLRDEAEYYDEECSDHSTSRACRDAIDEIERLRNFLRDYGTGPSYEESPEDFANRVVRECNAKISEEQTND